MIKIYVYSKDSGLLSYIDTGLEDYVLLDIPDKCDFTLTPPPNTYEPWRWIDDKWIADQPS